jgi:hypothetical protein
MGRLGFAVSIFFYTVVTIGSPAVLRRVTVAELERDPYLSAGHEPFILEGAMESWGSMELFKDEGFFRREFPESIVDFYPRNLHKSEFKPYLVPMGGKDFANGFFLPDEGARGTGDDFYSQSRYIHWRMHLSEFQEIKHLFEPLPNFMKVDETWMEKCFPGKTRDEWPLDNFFRHAHWRIIIIGQKNSSMFMHGDGFQTATFVSQFVGRKRWIVCSPEYARNLYRAGDIDMIHPETIDHVKFPLAKHADCSDSIVYPGEIIYYPAHWWHQTFNLDTPTISMAGRRIDGHNFKEVSKELEGRCNSHQEDISKIWPGAAPILSKTVCQHIPHCSKIWQLLWDTPLSFMEAANDRFH